MNNYPQHVNDLNHHILQKEYLSAWKNNIFPFLLISKIESLNQSPFFPGVNFYGVLFYGNKMGRKPVDQTGAKSKKPFDCLCSFYSFTSVAVGNVGFYAFTFFFFPGM